jgi:hypothetical protein
VNQETYLHLEDLEPTVENLSASMQTNVGMLEYFLVLKCQQPWFGMQLNHACMTKAGSTDAYKITFSSHYHTSKTKYMCNIKIEKGTVELILIMYWSIKGCQLYLATKLHMLHCKKLKCNKISDKYINVDAWVNPVNQTF